MTHDHQPPIVMELPAPIVEDLLPDSPAWDETGLVPADKAQQPLQVKVPPWLYTPVPGFTTTLDLYLRTGVSDHPAGHRAWPDDQPSIPPEELEFLVAVALLQEGEHQLWYELTTHNDFYESLFQPITIDKTAPAFGLNQGALLFDTSTVTAQYLIDNNDQVLAEVPAYSGFKPGDVITWYWAVDPDPLNAAPADIVDTRTLIRSDTQPLTIAFPGDMIRARGDGERHAFYELADRAGNRQAYSRPVRLAVDAHLPVRDLPQPTVAEAMGNTLNLTNARNGATVVVPDTAVILPGDMITVQWAAPGSYGEYRTDEADATGKRFTVPAQYIPQHMGQRIDVYYEVSGIEPMEKSEVLGLNVSGASDIGWRTIQCTRPIISAGQLSLATVDSHATFTLNNWAFMGLDQRVTITLSGIGTVHVALDKHVVDQSDIDNKKVEADVLKSVLTTFPLGPLNVQVKVSFDGGKTELPFPTLNLTLVA